MSARPCPCVPSALRPFLCTPAGRVRRTPAGTLGAFGASRCAPLGAPPFGPCVPLARASLGPCVPFCVRPRGGCAGHPLGRSVPSAPGLPLRPASLSASAREAGAQGTRWDAQCRQGVASCALKIVSCKNEKHLLFKDDPPKKRFSRRCSPILGTKRTYATIHQSSSSNPPPPIQ